MSNDLPHITNGHSPQEVSAGEILHRETDEIPDGLLDFASGFMEEFLPAKPEAEEVEKGAAEELTAEEIEAADEELELDEELSDEETEIIGYDELKGHTFEFKVGGEKRQLTIDQIASELGQVKAASRVQNEVKEQKEALQSEKERLSDARELLRQQETAFQGNEELSIRAAEINNLQSSLQQARQHNDIHSIARLNDIINMKTSEYQQVQDNVSHLTQIAEERVIAQEARKLQEQGYGYLTTDKERQSALESYATESLSKDALNLTIKDATLAIALEKARLYDKAKSKKSNVKQNTGKNLKPSKSRFAPKEKELTPDEVFQQAADRMLKGLI